MRPSVFVMLGIVGGFVVAGCTTRSDGTSASTTPSAGVATAEPTALAPVAVGRATAPPSWIAGVSPTGEAADGAQIRVRFTNDVVPIDALESNDRAEILRKFSLQPALPGRFVILTPRMIAFAADAPIPHAARIAVTLAAGLADRAGHTLATDYTWTFTTAPLVLSGLPGQGGPTPGPQPLRPTIGLDASDAVDADSLVAHAYLAPRSGGAHVALALAPSPSPDPSATATSTSDASGPANSDTGTNYLLQPASDLAYDTAYDVVIEPGVAPKYGNVPAARGARGALRTYGKFRFTGVTHDTTDGRFADGMTRLDFSNGVRAASVGGALTLRPAPAAALPLTRVDDASIALDPDALKPATLYDVTIKGSLADVFGQTLGDDVTTSFSTGDLAPHFFAPDGFTIFPADADLAIDLTATNLARYKAAYRVVRPTDLVTHDPSLDEPHSLLPPPAAWGDVPVAGTRNVPATIAVPIRAKLGATTGLLAYAFAANAPPGSTPTYGAVQLTDLGVFAQWFPDDGYVSVHRLSDGMPVPNAHVDVYESFTDGSERKPPDVARPCASGATDAGGTWHAARAAFAACASTALAADQAPALLAVVTSGRDWAFARSSAYGETYRYGLYGTGWSAGEPNARGAILSDRSLYQPGETANFVGIGYFDIDGDIVRGRSASYALTATAPSGATLQLGKASLDAFGALSLAHTFDARAEVGDYTITATGSGGERLSGEFRVAEFKPPNFKVDLTLDRAAVTAGASVASTSQSSYLFGAPVDGGTSHVAVTRSQATFAPPGYDEFSFGPQWFYPEEPPSPTSDVLQRDLTIDASGKASLAIPVATDLPFPMQYTVSAETTDVSNLSVADTKSFLAFPGDAVVGLSTPFVATAGAKAQVRAIVLDTSGKPLGGREIAIVLQQRVADAATQIVAGAETPKLSVHYVDVDRAVVTPGTQPATVALTPPKAGDYRLVANFTNGGTDATATQTELWATGADATNWFSDDPGKLTVKLDKATYRPGDVATALVQSPYPEAELAFSVVRHGVLYASTTVVRGGAPRVSFRVTPEMLPNAAVQVVLVRRGRPLHAGIPTGLDRLAKLGFATFEVALDAKYLGVGVEAAHASLAPAAKQHLAFRLRDAAGKPVAGEVVVAVVNDAILQLSGYRFPDLVKTVYADLPISTRIADNRADVKLASAREAVEKGFGFGGGVMAGPAGTRVRRKFAPLAYWNAAVKTDAQGAGAVDFTLPDDLTTWRVMAIGLGPGARFGNGESTFVTTLPLVTNPILPQFVRPGDRFSAGLSMTQTGSGPVRAQIAGTLTGGVTFAGGDPHAASAEATLSPATQAQRFDLIASGTQDAKLAVRTQVRSSSGVTASDAFEFALPVVTDDAFESVVTTGTTTDSASVPLAIDPALVGTLGGLDVTLASTLLAESMEPARALAEEPDPFLEDRAGRLAIAADATILDRTFGRTSELPRLAKSAATELEALGTLELSDGGYAFWPGAKTSELYSTAFAAQQLVQARGAGFDVAAPLARVRGFLRKALANPQAVNACLGLEADAAGVCFAGARLEALETLGAMGEVRNDFVAAIFAREGRLSYYERVELARFLLRLPDWHARGIALRDKLFEQVSLGSRLAVVDDRAGGESPVAGQAQMLGLAIASATPGDDVDRLLRSLLDQRHAGRWGCTCDDAEAMNALVLYAARDAAPPSLVATLNLPANPPAAAFHDRFTGYATTSVTHSVALADLHRGAGTVALAMQGHGTLHYVVALRYAAPPTAPGIYAGIRVDRILRVATGGTPLASFGLATPAAATHVSAGRVYDVEDRIVSDHPLDDLVIEDPLPGGFEAVDQSFRTATPTASDPGDAWTLDYQSIYRDRVLSFVRHVPAGSYAIHYLVRSVTPGTFGWPGARAFVHDAPEEFGRTAATQLAIE